MINISDNYEDQLNPKGRMSMQTKKDIKIIAHRGAMELAPENTLSSFRKALEIGADAVEFDLHMSLDNKLVVRHDYEIETKDGKRKLICGINSQEIKKRVPFLGEVLTLLVGKCKFEIELKGSTISFVKRVIRMAKKFDVLGDIEFTSPHPFILYYLKINYPKLKCGLFISPYPSWTSRTLGEKLIIDQMAVSRFDVAHIPLVLLNRDLVIKLHKMEKIVHAANCDKKSDILYALKCGVDQFSTANILLAKEVVKTEFSGR
jgi:glycerophosphoryl diester phosphodiesterase